MSPCKSIISKPRARFYRKPYLIIAYKGLPFQSLPLLFSYPPMASSAGFSFILSASFLAVGVERLLP